MPSAKDLRQRYSPEVLQQKITEGSKVNPETGCWEWQKGISGPGYGSMFDGKDSLHAHKISYEAFFGIIPKAAKNTLVIHTCHNKLCVNPHHLKLGSRRENTYDALQAGAYGEKRRVLTKEERQEIKALYAQGKSMRWIAKLFSSNHPQISRAIKENDYAFS